MDLGLAGKNVIVTAGSGGLGYHIARAYASEGASVTVSARNPDRLEAAVAKIRMETGGSITAVVADVTDADAIGAMIDQVEERHGGIDVLVSNSGGANTAPFIDMTDDLWRDAAETKIIPQIRAARLVFRKMIARGAGGRIIFMAGTHGRQPHAHAITAGYCNAALQNVNKALSEDGGPHNILCNVINPGPVATERMVYLAQEKARDENIPIEQAVAELTAETVLKRYGKPEELAAVAVFLGSAQASYVTGSTIDVDGGQVKTI
jgi:3-oxoacyl-[acyl-carrier protein] reductase